MTVRKTVAFAAIVLAASAWPTSARPDDDDVARAMGSTWSLNIRLNAPNLEPPAVQWAILDKDPVARFRAGVQRMRTFYRQQSGQVDEAQKKIARSSQMTVSWDSGFHQVQGSELYLLTGGPRAGHEFMSNGPDGKKWIVSKIVRIQGKPVCWCLPIEVQKGKQIEVELTEDNVFDLESVFDSVMEGTDQAAKPVEPQAQSQAQAGTKTGAKVGTVVSSGAAAGAERESAAQPKPPKTPEKTAQSNGPSLIGTLAKKLGKSEAKSKSDAKAKPKLTWGDPAGYALYEQMIQAMRKAQSLSYVSHYEMASEHHGRSFSSGCTYRVWLKKPNYFRVETENQQARLGGAIGTITDIIDCVKSFWPGGSSPAEPKKGGILVGDGKNLWIYWPEGRPRWGSDDEKDEKALRTCYMTKHTPLGGHSIGHEVCYLGGMSMPVIDPSTFHGYTDSLQPYLDGVQSQGTEKVGDEDCDKIEVSIMKHQRIWNLWLSQRDHLPRKLREIVRVSFDLHINEDWSEVTVDGDIPDAQFAWKPPKDWKEWKEPPIEAGLLKPGTTAPDFELASADGKLIKLSDYRGQVVWLYVWRAG